MAVSCRRERTSFEERCTPDELGHRPLEVAHGGAQGCHLSVRACELDGLRGVHRHEALAELLECPLQSV